MSNTCCLNLWGRKGDIWKYYKSNPWMFWKTSSLKDVSPSWRWYVTQKVQGTERDKNVGPKDSTPIYLRANRESGPGHNFFEHRVHWIPIADLWMANLDIRRILLRIKQKKFDDNAWIPEIILAAPFQIFRCSKMMQWGTFELVYRYPETKLCWGIRGPFVLRCLSSGQFRALFPPQQISTLILTQYVRLVVRISGPVRFPGFGVR